MESLLNRTTGADDSLFGFHNQEKSYLIILPLAILTSSFDIFTIAFLLLSKKLRTVPNYPILSFMLAAVIQDFLAAPLYIYRYIHTKFVDHHYWVCAVYRFSYFLSGHTMKISLLIVSFDRLCSIKYSLHYRKMVSRKNMLVVLLSIWIFVTIIDIIPFYMKAESSDSCTYVPTHHWGMAVITMFNTIPFVILVINYIVIWKIAFRKGFRDRKLRNSIGSLANMSVNSTMADRSALRRPVRSVDDYEVGDVMISPPRTLQYTTSRTSVIMYAFELKATRSALAFTGMYLLCWGPMAVFYFIDNATKNKLTSSKERHLVLARFVIKIISFSASTFAPLVYIWRSKLFREEIQRKCFPKRFRKKRSEAAINILKARQ